MTPQELFDGNRRLASRAIRDSRSMWRGRVDHDDANQIALMALWNAANNYDGTSASFSTYAYRCMVNEFIEVQRLAMCQKRGGGVNPCSLEGIDVADSRRPQSDASEQMQICEEAMEWLPKKVSHFLRERYINGKTVSEAAAISGFGHNITASKEVSRAVIRFRSRPLLYLHARYLQNVT